MHIGTTTVENLLRVARRDSAAGAAFAAFDTGRASEIISVPEAGSVEGLSADELSELVRQASADPEFDRARVFVRSARAGRQVTLAVAPLHERGGRSMIGLVAEPDRRFEVAHLDVLGQLAERLVRHLRVVQQLARGWDPGTDRADPGANGGGERSEPLRDAGPWEPGAQESVPGAQESVPGAQESVPGAPEFPISVGASALVGDVVPPPPRHSFGTSGIRGARTPSVWAPGEGSAGSAPDRTGGSTSVVGPALQTEWWAEDDPGTRLRGLARFFSRAGRLLAPGARSAGTFVLVVVEVPDVRTAQAAAQVLAATLRSTDPVGRVAERLFAAALLVADETGDTVEERLAAAVGSALDRPAGVRTAQVSAAPGDDRDLDELLRDALGLLDDR